jgi:hypothetical protein
VENLEDQNDVHSDFDRDMNNMDVDYSKEIAHSDANSKRSYARYAADQETVSNEEASGSPRGKLCRTDEIKVGFSSATTDAPMDEQTGGDPDHNHTAAQIEHQVLILLKEGRLMSLYESKEIIDSLHTLAFGNQEDRSSYYFLKDQCKKLADVEIKMTQFHKDVVSGSSKEAVKNFDEHILFPTRKAFCHRCAFIYILDNGDTTNLAQFFQEVIKPIYEQTYGQDSKECNERMAQIRNSLLKANIFPAMQSNNAKQAMSSRLHRAVSIRHTDYYAQNLRFESW